MSNAVWQYTESGRLSTVLVQATKDIPEPDDDGVVVRTKAMALNPCDEQIAQSSAALLKFLGGKVIPGPTSPGIPGADFAGVVHSAGKDSKWAVGDEVYGIKAFAPLVDGHGTLQEYIKIPSSTVMVKKPESLSWEQAAALPLVYLTVYTAFVHHGKLPFDQDHSGRSVLILGGSSGTGNVAIQLAKKMGLRVVTTCSSKNTEFVKSLGADEVIDYRTEHVLEKVLISHYAPYAVILDCVGGTELLGHLDHLLIQDAKAPHLGIYVTIVGDKTSRDAMGGAATNYYYPSQVIRNFRGSLKDKLPTWLPLRSWVVGERYVCMNLLVEAEILETIPDFLAAAKEIKIDSKWPFKNAKQAFEKLESSRAVGKIVIEME